MGRKVSGQKVQDLVDDLAKKGRGVVRTFETSSKSGKNIEAVFESVAKDFLDDPANENLIIEDDTLSLEDTSPRTSFLCCRIS